MNPQPTSASKLSRATTAPDLDALRTELATVLAQSGGIRDRQDRARNTVQCIWEGQSTDYRRHEADTGEPAAPFEGAPDQRVPVTEMIIRERAALYVETLTSGEIQAVSIGSLDQGENAVKMSRTLQWLRKNRMEELEHEAELLANYVLRDDPGIAVLKIWWKREPALEMRELSIDDVGTELLKTRGIELGDPQTPEGQQDLQRYGGAISDVGDLIFNITREDEAVDAMAEAFPSVKRNLLKRSLRALRKNRETALPLPYVKENRPCVSALRYMRDIFFPADIDDLKKARVIWELEWLNEADLRAREHSEGYAANWIEEVIEAGPGGDETDATWLLDGPWTRQQIGSARAGDAETQKQFPIWHAYTKAADDYGIPGVYWTVYSAKVRDSYGSHELLDYPDGEYPHLIFRAEIIARGVENVRGTAETAGSFQSEIKLQRDSRGAHTMMATIPPVRVAERRGALEAVLGPMVEVPVREADDVTWMTPPPFPQASIEMEKAAWSDLNRYFGSVQPGMPAEAAETMLKNEVRRWLGIWKQAFAKIAEMQQEYGDPTQMQLVAGGPIVTYGLDEIRGRFAVSLTFNVRDLNIEFVIARNQAIAAVLQNDIGGNVDRTPIVRAGLRAIDPALADQALRDPQVVTQKEIEDERGAVNMLANGIEAPLRRSGINAQLRLQELQRTVTTSPVLSQRYNTPAGPADEYFKQLVDNRAKNLAFLVQQYGPGPGGNKAIGQQGTAEIQPGAGVASAMPGAVG